MIVDQIDERAIEQEFEPAFVVYLFEASDPAADDLARDTDTYLIRDATLSEVMDWLAGRIKGDVLWSLGVLSHEAGSLTWIFGGDPHVPVHTRTALEIRRIAEMSHMRGTTLCATMQR